MGMVDLADEVRNSALIEAAYFIPKEVGLSVKLFFLRLGLICLLLKPIRMVAKLIGNFPFCGGFLFESGYSGRN